MAVRNVVKYDVQAGITGTGDAFVVQPTAGNINACCVLTGGTPVNGAIVQFTLDDPAAIAAATAQWVDSPLGSRLVSGSENVLQPVSAVRLKVTDGTWLFQVRQG